MSRLNVVLAGLVLAVFVLSCVGCKDGDKLIIISVAPTPAQMPDKVTGPTPTDGAIDVPVGQVLSWTASADATSYDVYLGSDSFSVADAGTSSAEFAGNQTDITYDPSGLAYDTTYYWRVDSVNSFGVTRGDVWVFTTINQDLPPVFRGLNNIAAAGPSAVYLGWEAAVDDRDSAALIVYNVYGATISGGYSFTTPILTTGPGATSVVVTDADYAAITAGAEVFFVVRAEDASGNEDINLVELSVILPSTSDIIYVDDDAAGPGTGAIGDPYPAIQDGIDAAETAGGGTILVSGGSYNEMLDFTVAGTTPISMMGGFPDWSTFSGTPTESDILSARDTLTYPSEILGSGLTYATPEDGLVEIFNDRRPTTIDGFSIIESEDISIRGVDVDLKISGCIISDVDETTVPNKGIDLDTSATNIFNNIQIIGTEITNHRYGVEFGGGCRNALFLGNYFHDIADMAVYSKTDLTSAVVLDEDSIVVPMGDTCTILFDSNQIVNTDGIDWLDFEPQVPASAGNLVITLTNNIIQFTHSSDALDIDDAGFFGEGGSFTMTVTNNFFNAVSSDFISVDFIEDTSLNPVVDGSMNLTFTNNKFLHSNSDSIDIQSFCAAQSSTSRVTVTDNVFDHNESNQVRVNDEEVENTDMSGSSMEIYIRRNVFYGGDEPVRLDVAPAPDGNLVVEVTDNDYSHNYGYAVDITSQHFCATPIIGTPVSNCTVIIAGNWGITDDNSLELDIGTFGGVTNFFVTGNRFSCSDSECCDVSLRANDYGAGTMNFYCFNNNFYDSYSDSIEVDIQADTDGNEDEEFNIFMYNNSTIGSWERNGIEMSLRSNTLSLVARNESGFNDVDSDEPLEIRRNGNLSAGYCTVRNNILAYGGGDGIRASTVYAQIINNTVSFNGQYSTSDGGIDGWGDTYSNLHIENCIVFRNCGYDLDDNPLVRAKYSLIGREDESAGFGNITGNPLYVGYSDHRNFNRYFRLASTSPAINAGNPDARYNDPDGTRNNMGAFGGPDAGDIGFLGGNRPIPMLVIGARPFSHLFTGQRLLAPDSDIRLIFTNPVDSATVDATSITFASGVTVISGTLATTGNEVTFTPASPFTEGSEITVTASTAVQDTSGQSNGFSWYLDTAVEPATTLESETNDTTATANALPGDVFRMLGALDSGGADATDLYSFSAGVGDRLMATIFAERGAISTGDFQLTLLAADGTTVISFNDSSFGDLVTGNNYDPYIDYTFTTAGTYYLLVQENNAAGAEAYELEGWLKK